MKNRILFLISLFFIFGCSSKNNRQDKLIRKVKIEPVLQADSLSRKSFPGLIKEAGELNLSFRVAGPIEKIFVKEGDYVHSGQVIAQIDNRDYKIQLQAAEAQYNQINAEATRVIELHNRQSVAKNDYDKAISGRQMAEAKLKNAKDQYNDTQLKAPVSGYIEKLNFLEKEIVNAGMPIITMINSEYYLAEVEIPISLYINKDKIISFSAFQQSISGQPIPLELISYSKKANNNQLYKLQLGFNKSQHPKLAPGMDLEIIITVNKNIGPLVCIPLNALFNKEGNTYVWVYNSKTGSISMRNITTDELTGDGRIKISKGLNVGEQIVTAGVSLLNEGEHVEPIKATSKTNIGGLL